MTAESSRQASEAQQRSSTAAIERRSRGATIVRRAGLSFAATGNKQLTKFIARLQSLATSCNGWYGSDGYCLMPRPLSSPVLSFQLTTLLKLVDRVRKHGEGGGQSGTPKQT